MNVSRNEHTIAARCKVTGRGYWSGKRVTVKMNPASAGTGIVLVRTDVPGHPTCPAVATYRHDTALRTVLQHKAAKFQLVEHLMAALYAMEIDNCIVEIDTEELPGLDGSSGPYVEALQSAGLIIQASEKSRVVITEPLTVRNGDSWIHATPNESGQANFEYRLSFDDHGPIAAQQFRFKCSPSRFAREVASARTFVTQSQAEQLKSQGIAAHVSYQDLLVFGDDGIIDNQLRFENECARHKTLDLIGDLALTGVQLVGNFVSHRGGHNLNGQLAQKLLQMVNEQNALSDNTQPNNQENRAA